ncbi:MAG: DNA topoisomerase IV subunit A [Candidatus Puniceispirillum sp.]|nr:DNA topoisomerase IV subunit A [Candidatus Pelagibacter sp.]MBA4283032.1 DNA topoisomerase IV subunit A [Candidatus Puniceispirillum sp.]
MAKDNLNTHSVISVDFQKALGDRYLSYALSTIMSRSLPDLRDGLKPVHRRLIYAMYQLKLNPQSGFKKCARVVGDVIGKFHPHGDAAVYAAMVRLAQNFSVRYPLVEGQGNFGNIDGDSPAAMRYTEAKLTPLAMELLHGLEDDCVDFLPTYDGEDAEPVVFPACFPNLLANGSTGIAVGMATSIPPHNLSELCDAMLLLIDKPESTVPDLLRHVKGPDFPTGGILVDDADSILKIYETGRGSFRVRSKYEIENLKNGMYQIVITEIPFMIEKSRLIEKIADIVLDKKIPLIDDVQDESAEDIRIVITPKNKNVAAEVLMEMLFKMSDLESRFAVNLNVLDKNNVPQLMDLKQILRGYLDHQIVILLRKSNHRIQKIENRLEILDALMVAYLNIDEVIRIIREEDDPKLELISRFNLSEVQAEAILNMRLRSLRKIQEIEILTEKKELEDERKKLQKLVDSTSLQYKEISKRIIDLKSRFGENYIHGKRQTKIDPLVKNEIAADWSEYIEKEDITIYISEKYWIRSVKGHALSEQKYKEGDQERFVLKCTTLDRIVLCADDGKFFTISGDKINRSRGFGDPVRMMVDLVASSNIVDVYVIPPSSDDLFLLVSNSARGFCVKSSDLIAQTKNGKNVFNLDDGEKMQYCLRVEGDLVACLGQNRKMVVFSIEEIPIMSRGKGVILQKYKDGTMSDLSILKSEKGLFWIRNNKVYNLLDLTLWKGKRASSGRLAPTGFPRDNKFQVIPEGASAGDILASSV